MELGDDFPRKTIERGGVVGEGTGGEEGRPPSDRLAAARAGGFVSDVTSTPVPAFESSFLFGIKAATTRWQSGAAQEPVGLLYQDGACQVRGLLF